MLGNRGNNAAPAADLRESLVDPIADNSQNTTAVSDASVANLIQSTGKSKAVCEKALKDNNNDVNAAFEALLVMPETKKESNTSI